MRQGSSKNQCLATISVNLVSITYGIACGWPSMAIPTLGSDDSPIGPQSEEVLSWMVGMMCIGGFSGTIFCGWVTNIVGRIKTLWYLGIPALASWLLILFAPNAMYILIARFLIGFVGGGTFVIVPIYIAEISEDHIRGILSSALVFFCNLGIILAFIIGHFCTFTVGHWIYSAFPIVFCISTYFLPETPVYLMSVNKLHEAEQSLAYYRNKLKNSQEHCEVYKAELSKLKKSESNADISETGRLLLSDFTNRTAMKAMFISVGLVSLNQLCGCFALVNYTSLIFKESGSNLSPNISAIIVGAIQLLGSCVASNLVDRSGRKFLIGLSALGTGVGLSALGMHGYLKLLGHDVSAISWVPVVSFSFVIFIASLGVLTLPFVVISEVLPQKIRPIGTSFCMCVLWLLAFTTLKYFFWMSNLLGMHGVVFLFSGFSFIGTVFVIIYVPETKGKSFDEIMKLL